MIKKLVTDEDIKHCADIRVYNKKKIVELLIPSAKTKKQISNLLGISVSTASSLCNSLAVEGILFAESTNNSEGGRIPQKLSVHPDSRYAVSLNLVERDIITVALVDLCGNIIRQEHADCRELQDFHELILFSVKNIMLILQKENIDHSIVMGIGVAICGSEIEESGLVCNAYGNPILNGQAVRAEIEKECGFPVFVENEANAAVLALYQEERTVDPTIQDAVYFYVGDGIGVGVVSRGQLLKGHHGVGCEINHLALGNRNYRCYCNQTNCIDTEISIVGFQRKYFEDSGISHAYNRYGWKLMEDDVREGTKIATDLIEENGVIMGKTIALLCQIFDSKNIWIGGFDEYIFEKLYPYIYKEVHNRSIFNDLFTYNILFDEGFHSIITRGCYQLVFKNWMP